jgi:hypothetical protein
MNLLTALEHDEARKVVNGRAMDGIAVPPDLLAHVSPPGWEYIKLTGKELRMATLTLSVRGIC